MSEQAPVTNHEHFEALPLPERHEALPTAAQAEALRPGESDPLQQLEQARSSVEAHIISNENPLKRLEAEESDKAAAAAPSFINKELKDITLKRELKQLQRHLPASQRALSKVVHQPVIRALSEASAKTLSRPSGLLGGGLTAFVGTSAYLYFAKHIGLRYNYSVFLVLFLGGFLLGLGLELIVWLATSNRRKAAE